MTAWLIYLCLLCAIGLVRCDFYVSTTGNDGANGTQCAPFRTLARAQTAVRAAAPGMKADINVFVGPGLYQLSKPLNFTAKDSGLNGHRIVWQAQDMQQGANISGGMPVTGWELSALGNNIYTAKIPRGFQSRHFYADQRHMQIARKGFSRSSIKNTTEGFQITGSDAQFIKTMSGLNKAEIISFGSWTSRVSGIQGLSPNGTIIMRQPAWNNNNIGYDTFSTPYNDYGIFAQNSLSVLDEANEWYLNSSAGAIYYKPPDGMDINTMSTVLGRLEQLLVVSGTYDNPVHNIVFKGFNYMHTTWNSPSSDIGYVDQQTGVYLGENKTYTVFESSRPFWWQVPGSIQVSAANNILFQNGSISALFGGFGIGNNPQAHTSGVGYGASDVEISGMYLHQTGINAITIGGVLADAHHPSDPRMTDKNIRVLENIFTDLGYSFTDATSVLTTYAQNTQIVSNDIYNLPYSGICYGWGWGSNDAGGSDEYALRGLYNYQPRYTTPTILKGGYIAKNLIHDYGTEHFDLGGIYTLSDSPNTSITANWIFDSRNGSGLYHDEGSREYVTSRTVFAQQQNWLNRNEQQHYTTGNLTIENVAAQGPLLDGTNQWGDIIINQTQFSNYSQLSADLQSVVRNSGIPPASRRGRPVSVTQYPV